MDENILKLANEMAKNVEAEADAIGKYNNALYVIEESSLDKDLKETLKEGIEEIIADELNHAEKLQEFYTMVTGIEAMKD